MTDLDLLQLELEFFRQKKAELLADHEGKFALVKNKEIVGIFDTEENAYAFGITKFGNVPFLIALINSEEPVARMPALTLGLLRARL